MKLVRSCDYELNAWLDCDGDIQLTVYKDGEKLESEPLLFSNQLPRTIKDCIIERINQP